MGHVANWPPLLMGMNCDRKLTIRTGLSTARQQGLVFDGSNSGHVAHMISVQKMQWRRWGPESFKTEMVRDPKSAESSHWHNAFRSAVLQGAFLMLRRVREMEIDLYKTDTPIEETIPVQPQRVPSLASPLLFSSLNKNRCCAQRCLTGAHPTYQGLGRALP